MDTAAAAAAAAECKLAPAAAAAAAAAAPVDECKLTALQWYMLVAPPVDMLAALDDPGAKRTLTWLPLWYLATLGPDCEAQVSRVHAHPELVARQFTRMRGLATEVLETFYPNMYTRTKGATHIERCIDFYKTHCLSCRALPFPESGFRVAPLAYVGQLVLCRSHKFNKLPVPIVDAHMRLMDIWKQDTAMASLVGDLEGVIWRGAMASAFMRGFDTPNAAWWGRFDVRADAATWHLLALTNNPSGLDYIGVEPVSLADMFTSEMYECNLEEAAAACKLSSNRHKYALEELESSGARFVAISERALAPGRARVAKAPRSALGAGCAVVGSVDGGVETQLWEKVLALSTPSIGETPESLRAAFDTTAFVRSFVTGKAAKKTLEGTAKRFLRHHYATVLIPSDIRYLTGNLARSIDTWVAGSVEYPTDTLNVHVGVGALRDIQTAMTDYSTDLNIAVINIYMLRRILFNGVSKYTRAFREPLYVARVKTGIALMSANGCLDHCLFQLRMVYPDIMLRVVIQYMITDNPIVFEGLQVRAARTLREGHQPAQHRVYVLYRKEFNRNACTC